MSYTHDFCWSLAYYGKRHVLLFLNDLFNVFLKFHFSLFSSNTGKNLFFKPHKLEKFPINSSGISIVGTVRFFFSLCVV